MKNKLLGGILLRSFEAGFLEAVGDVGRPGGRR